MSKLPDVFAKRLSQAKVSKNQPTLPKESKISAEKDVTNRPKSILAGLMESEMYKKGLQFQNKKAVRKQEAFSLVTNIADFNTLLRRIVNDLGSETKDANTVRNIKQDLKQIPPYFSKHVSTWTDSNELDLLHHTIISNKPDLLTFLLTETNYFPQGFQPQSNPYAHLAALLGHVECLKALLQYRPATYFKAENLSHAIRLPPHIKKKARLNAPPIIIPKGVGKVLEKIKTTNIIEEQMQPTMDIDEEDQKMVDTLSKQLVAMEGVKHKKRISLSGSFARKGSKSERRRSREKRPEESSEVASSRPSTVVRQKSFASIMESHSHNNLRRKREKGKHIITVYWDALSDMEPGVVKGAGQPVAVRLKPLVNGRKDTLAFDRGSSFFQSKQISLFSSKEKPATKAVKSSSSKQRISTTSSERISKKIDYGIRGNKKLKDFELKKGEKIEQNCVVREIERYLNKTPLTYAAERGHVDCVQLILNMVVTKRNPKIATKEPLTLATKAKSPEALMLLMETKCSRTDHQSAVMLAIREMYPDCLTALLSKRERDRQIMPNGLNLFHVLYSQSVISSKRFELMPEMTRALIMCHEDVNAHTAPSTFPMYTLINCAFNITVGKHIFYFIECLNILLESKANPHFDEEKMSRTAQTRPDTFTRQAFHSAISCVFESAKNSLNFFESSYWSKLFMKKLITTIEECDLTPRRVQNTILFDYMQAVPYMGLDSTIARCLLRYGGNPDCKRDGKYPVNVYFDYILPHLNRFEVSSYDRYFSELDTLMIICRFMSLQCLYEALVIFLQDHLLSTPIQGLPISRDFAHRMDQLLRTPRTLADLSAKVIWNCTKRNNKKVRQLPIPSGFLPLISP